MYFIVCFIVLGIGLSMIGWAIFISDDNLADKLGFFGFTTTLLVALFGFLIIPVVFIGYEEVHYSKGFNYVKSPSTLYVEFIKKPNGQRESMQFNDVDTYNNIDNMRLKIVTSYNFYGQCVSNHITLVK